MKINIKFTDTEIDNKLREYAESKVNSFTKFLGSTDPDAVVCYIEFRHSTHHQSGKVCTAEVTLEADGKIYRSTKIEPKFEKAIDKVKDDIIKSLRVDKEKNKDMLRKGSAEIKEMMQTDTETIE